MINLCFDLLAHTQNQYVSWEDNINIKYLSEEIKNGSTKKAEELVKLLEELGFDNIFTLENVRNYLNNKFSSNRINENNDVVYSGILHNFIENENNLVFFHIDEIKNISKNIYVYYNNETNKSLLPHLTLKTT